MPPISTIQMARGLEFPAKTAATQVYSFMGRRGSGKTYAASGFVEQLLDVGHQVVVLDPVGVWWGLRLLADGRSPGFDIPVVGGIHGDIPLEATGGKIIAELAALQRTSLVLDVSDFTQADQRRFVTDFARELFQAKKRHRGALMVVLDEAQDFAPQNPEPGDAPMLGAIQRMAKLGRNFGIGMALLSQRPQEVSKKVLNLSEVMFAFQLNGLHERKAVAAWVQDKNAEGGLDLAGELPSLPVGTAYVWSPQWLRIFGRYEIFRKRSFDASATPDDSSNEATASLAPIDLKAVQRAMAASIEEAKQNDPKALREELARLRAEVARQSVPVVVVDALRAAALAGQEVLEQVEIAMLASREADRPAASATLTNGHQRRGRAAVVKETPGEPAPAALSVKHERPAARGPRDPLPSGAFEMLQGLAALGGRATKRQLATLAGFSPTVSTVRNYLSILRGEALIASDGPNEVVITTEGWARAGEAKRKTPRELFAMWSAQAPGKAREILALLAAEPGPFTREVIRDRCSIPDGKSTLRNYLSWLRTNGLIHKTRGGLVVNPLLAHH